MHLSDSNLGDFTNPADPWNFSFDLSRYPFLRDHAFQDMIVLPGSFYIDQALQFAKAQNIDTISLQKVSFEQVHLVDDQKQELTLVPVRVNGRQQIECQGSSMPADRPYAKMVLPGKQSHTFKKRDLDKFREEAVEITSSEVFYHKLLENGNQYGPHFRTVQRVWSGENCSLGLIAVNDSIRQQQQHFAVHPVMLDACVQVLALTGSKPGQTFVLSGFENIHLQQPLTEDFFCLIELTEEHRADLTLFNLEGQPIGALEGVSYSFLDYQNQSQPTNQLQIASNFTADLVKESLDFWSSKLAIPFSTEIAPYNQVFQELLNPASGLQSNQSGANILLINLADWARKGHRLHHNFDRSETRRILEDRNSYRLPNGLEIAHLNQYETEYVFQEIFLDRSYLKHDIALEDGDIIIDIGANIGLFSLWVNHMCQDPVVYAYEPSPVVHEILATNAKLYGKNIRPFAYGVSDRRKEAEFTFYEKSSVFSSFNADEELDKEAISAVVRNMLRESATTDTGALDQYVEEIMVDRMQSKHFTCKLISIDDIIQENDIEHIDLLKIDAEKSELPILQGISDENWLKIKQIVMEVHDTEGPVIEEVRSILEQQGFDFHIEEEDLLQHSGLYNIFATRKGIELPVDKSDHLKDIRDNAKDFAGALANTAPRSSVPYLVMFTPPPEEMNDLDRDRIRDIERSLVAQIVQIDNVYAYGSEVVEEYYPVEHIHDPEGNQIGHVPYTPEYFAALGSTVSRKLYSLLASPKKVIVLDCDNTLWQGVVGEDGYQNIKISSGHKFLQEFMVKQTEAGMILCLCSKNAEGDVLQVFQKRSDMVLGLDKVVAHKINWESKSENIKQLAQELSLGLDSFIFIDDNPVECAEVRAACPSVVTLNLPADDKEIPGFLKNIWAFEKSTVTSEDRKRTLMYQQNLEREQLKQESLSLKSFIDGLNLTIRVGEPDTEHIPRISQLSHRTNQFNFTTIRRSETEVSKLLQSGDLQARIVHVDDRFGDYGLVGVMLYSFEKKSLKVDSFLLSCRVLGKGVAYRMLNELGTIAQDHGLSQVILSYLPTPKNTPALNFLETVAGAYKREWETGFQFNLPAKKAAEIKFDPHHEDELLQSTKPTNKKEAVTLVSDETLTEVARELTTATQILKQIQKEQAIEVKEDPSADFVAPQNDLEKSIAEIWQQVVGTNRVGVNDNFFEIGGTSLKGVQLVALLKKRLNLEISIVNLFENPTISSMVQGFQGGDEVTQKSAESSRARGASRRERRKVRSRR